MGFVAIILIVAGLFFFFTGTAGLLRFPDVYTRLHAAGKCDTLGAQLILLGIAVTNGVNLVSLKLLLITVFIMLANPTATHAMLRAALHSGEPFWKAGRKK